MRTLGSRAVLCALVLVAVAPAGAASASLLGISARCGAFAPAGTSCVGSGVFGPTATVGVGSTLAFTGTITVTVRSATASLSFEATYAAGQVVSRTSDEATGTFLEGQPYTLDGTAFGAGGWEVYVNT